MTKQCVWCSEPFETDNPQREKCDTCRAWKVSPDTLDAKRYYIRHKGGIRQSHTARK